ncbi:arf-GAP with dual PH domain-containing protein 1 [Ixodes scapularis]
MWAAGGGRTPREEEGGALLLLGVRFSGRALKMASDHNRRRILELLKLPGNNECADCGKKDPDWASYNLGVFLCLECSGIHRSLGSHVSRVRSLRLDRWEDSQVDALAAVGNIVARQHYEAHVPASYRRPTPDDVGVVKEQWVRAKYEREEFVHPDRQVYQEGSLEGWLNKRGKEDGRFHPRRFVLRNGTLKYYVKEAHKEPKAAIAVAELNAAFCPDKIGNKHGLQLTYVKDGSTRNIFLYSEDGKTIVDWYNALRCAKLQHLQVAFPGARESQLAQHLTRDFLKEGWLWKSGPRPVDQHRRRWFTLDDRKWMYHEDPLDAYPKGEIFLGHRGEGYTVVMGAPTGFKEMAFAFTVSTPYRKFVMGAENERDRSEWIDLLAKVMERPLSPQDSNMAATLVRKRPSLSSSLHILKVSRLEATKEHTSRRGTGWKPPAPSAQIQKRNSENS